MVNNLQKKDEKKKYSVPNESVRINSIGRRCLAANGNIFLKYYIVIIQCIKPDSGSNTIEQISAFPNKTFS
ncbi:hypothetical protein DERP_007636 [Dermatophagoides pteronyssinus]|uniref:Uncharacterized protein n=1 Tax=Dermatophagoides pteronyssinus TaxID=6956 RepID=A0ABQ8JKG1_DERPT|nr:hypothetical protein DERP_007636 [Dermatophagoides pteronyssinus]